ncbi:MAG: hypothetical protein IKN54_04665 [Lachnospiraceae bacterium]|nr:hypothetical protein [Lachnospiraceae bacterium]
MKQNYDKNELKKMQRASLAKLAAVAVFIVVVVIFNSLSWFTMSREVEGAGVQMTAEEVPFELMVTGDTTRADILQYVKENNESIYSVGSLYNNIAKHFMTGPDEEHMQIQWAGGTDEELEPGKSGDLTFYIIPNEKISANEFVTMYGDLKLFQMNIKGYRTIETVDEDTGKKEVTGLTDMETSSIFQGTVSYLNGHILFFKTHTITKDNDDNILSDKYTGLIDTTERFSLKETNYSIENGMIKVVLYWKWPTTFPKMIGVHSDADNIAGDASTTQAIIRYVLLHADYVLYGKTAQTVSLEDTLNEALLKTKFGVSEMNDLSKLYNKADSRIGADVHYVLFVLNAKYQ